MFRNENKPRHWTRQNAANSPLSLAIGHSTISPVLFVGVNSFWNYPGGKFCCRTLIFILLLDKTCHYVYRKIYFRRFCFASLINKLSLC